MKIIEKWKGTVRVLLCEGQFVKVVEPRSD